jgi:renalase
MKTLVLGAGMAGVTCAKTLRDEGEDVVVFDKARGPSGRMASRRSEKGSFDHGAPLFRVRNGEFQSAVDQWVSEGLVTRWAPSWSGDSSLSAFEWYTAQPRMSALLRRLSEGVECRWEERACGVHRSEGQWVVEFESGKSHVADKLICTLPAPQAADLLSSALPSLGQELSEIPFHGTWTGLFHFADSLPVKWDLHREGPDCMGPLHTVVRESTKPGRDGGERVVVHALDRWSDDHLDLEKEEALPLLRDALKSMIGELPLETFSMAHRWRYAHSSAPWGRTHYWKDGLGIAGDWCLGAGVGAAWGSGHALARSILGP